MFDVTRLQEISSQNRILLERVCAYAAANVYHLTSPAALLSRSECGRGMAGALGRLGSQVVRSFVQGDGDRGSWSPWLPWRGFNDGVWGIDAASSVASGGFGSLDFPTPSGVRRRPTSGALW